MSSRDLSQLEADFWASIEVLLLRCGERGVEMVPYCTIRTPAEQARLWRQSRSGAEVRGKIKEFKRTAPFLAGVLEGVAPLFGPQVTFALPGLSWHQWGEAVDCYWLVDGRAVWGNDAGYRTYRAIAIELGLHRGPKTDWPHIQGPGESPSGTYTMEQVNDRMRERFG